MNSIYGDSRGWQFFAQVSFGVAVLMMGIGVWAAPIDLALKGYFAMGGLFLVSASFTLSKAVRDQHEAAKLTQKLDEAKAEKLLMEYDRK